MGKKTTKDQTTQTLQEKLSEIDWDLLEQLEQEEEGQSIPMQDLQQTKASSQPSVNPQEMIDEHPGPILQPPPKGLLSQG
jgi:hypothetical protein